MQQIRVSVAQLLNGVAVCVFLNYLSHENSPQKYFLKLLFGCSSSPYNKDTKDSHPYGCSKQGPHG